MYKLGLLVNIGFLKTTDINIVFCYEQNHFVIKYFHDQRIADILSKLNSYTFYLPILFRDTKDPKISDYTLLSEIQYVKEEKALTGRGLELLAADTHVTYFDKNQGKLFKDGIEICDENPEYYFKTIRTGIMSSGPSVVIPERLANELNKDFTEIVSNIILRIYCLEEVVRELKTKNNLDLLFDIKDISQKTLCWSSWFHIINKYKSYLDDINISEILQSYKVSYHDSYQSKEDRIYIYREAMTDYKNAYDDVYLSELLGLGNNVIGRYEYYEEINIKMGDCKDEDLENEKEKILNDYSKEVHMACLIANDLYQRKLNQTGIKELEIQRNNLKDILFHYFKFDSFNQRDFYSFGNRYEMYGESNIFESKLREVNNKYSSITLLSK